MKSVIILIFGVIIYVVGSLIITPFLGYNFGAEPTTIERVLRLFIEYPFGLIKVLSEKYFILMLILNGLFWSTIFVKGTPILKRMILR